MLDIRQKIAEIGVLPLFRSSAAGFSVEEMYPQARWWTGGEDDPWQMRIALSQDPDIVYGKLFDCKAGFAHRRVYADLLNLRRDGWDFDALVDEGQVSLKERRLMDAAQNAGCAQFSYILKRDAGFAKGGLSGFDAVCANLQQKCYLLYTGFGRKVDRFGREYGWEIGILDTPERRFGQKFIDSAYEAEPGQSLEKLLGEIQWRDREGLRRLLTGEHN